MTYYEDPQNDRYVYWGDADFVRTYQAKTGTLTSNQLVILLMACYHTGDMTRDLQFSLEDLQDVTGLSAEEFTSAMRTLLLMGMLEATEHKGKSVVSIARERWKSLIDNAHLIAEVSR